MMKRQKGSVTVFAALSMMLVASLLLALLESARVYGLDTCAGLLADLGIESVCGEYQEKLWKEYRLLCLDGAYGTDDFSIDRVSGKLYEHLSANLTREDRGINLLELQPSAVMPVSYELLTDGDGSVFFEAVSSYMKQNLPREAAERILENYQNGLAAEKESDGYSVENASDTIEKALEERKAAEDGEGDGSSTEVEEGPQEVEENPLEIVLQLKQNAVLGMVVEQVETLSTSQISLEESLTHRKLEKGNGTAERDTEWYERILVLEYAGEYFSDYTKPATDHALAYELEYLLCGKANDKANLEGTVIRLLALREAANIIHIVGDSGKMNNALLLAEALAGFTGNVAIIKVVQAGIVAAWAYVESIQDVRALLAGDKIALIKSREQWTVDTENLLSSFQGTSKAKDCSNGLSYQNYLKMLLFTKSQKELAYRMMDIMEQNLRLTPLYQDCRLDYMICGLRYDVEFSAAPIFSRLVTIGKFKEKQLLFWKTTEFSYIS